MVNFIVAEPKSPRPHSPYDALTEVTIYNVSVGNHARCKNFFCQPWILYNSRNIEVSAKKKVELRIAHSFLYLLPGKDWQSLCREKWEERKLPRSLKIDPKSTGLSRRKHFRG